MATYNDIKQRIIETLMGRPSNTEIRPEKHQDYALNMLDYIRSVELVSSSTLVGFAEYNTSPIQPDNGNVCYIAGVSQNKTVVYNNFLNEERKPITIKTEDMQGVFVIFLWNKEYWTEYTFDTNIISKSDEALYIYNLNVRKTYDSISDMDNDAYNPIGDDGLKIKIGDLVTVVNDGFYSRTADGFEFQCKFNFDLLQEEGDSKTNAMSQDAVTKFVNEYALSKDDVLEGDGINIEEKNDGKITISSTVKQVEFTSDIQCNLAEGKSFGKYSNQDVIPAIGKTIPEVLLDIAAEIINPTLSLTSDISEYDYDSVELLNPTLNFSIVINNVGASLSSLSLKRDGVEIDNDITIRTFVDSIQLDITNNENQISYTLECVDTAGGIQTANYVINSQPFIAPTNTVLTKRLEFGEVENGDQLVLSNIQPNISIISQSYSLIGSNGKLSLTDLNYDGNTDMNGVLLKNINNGITLICDVIFESNNTKIKKTKTYEIVNYYQDPHLLRTVATPEVQGLPDYDTMRAGLNLADAASFEVDMTNGETSMWFCSNRTFTKAYNKALPISNWNDNLTYEGDFQYTADSTSELTYKLYKFQTGGSPACIVKFE